MLAFNKCVTWSNTADMDDPINIVDMFWLQHLIHICDITNPFSSLPPTPHVPNIFVSINHAIRNLLSTPSCVIYTYLQLFIVAHISIPLMCMPTPICQSYIYPRPPSPPFISCSVIFTPLFIIYSLPFAVPIACGIAANTRWLESEGPFKSMNNNIFNRPLWTHDGHSDYFAESETGKSVG